MSTRNRWQRIPLECKIRATSVIGGVYKRGALRTFEILPFKNENVCVRLMATLYEFDPRKLSIALRGHMILAFRDSKTDKVAFVYVKRDNKHPFKKSRRRPDVAFRNGSPDLAAAVANEMNNEFLLAATGVAAATALVAVGHKLLKSQQKPQPEDEPEEAENVNSDGHPEFEPSLPIHTPSKLEETLSRVARGDFYRALVRIRKEGFEETYVPLLRKTKSVLVLFHALFMDVRATMRATELVQQWETFFKRHLASAKTIDDLSERLHVPSVEGNLRSVCESLRQTGQNWLRELSNDEFATIAAAEELGFNNVAIGTKNEDDLSSRPIVFAFDKIEQENKVPDDCLYEVTTATCVQSMRFDERQRGLVNLQSREKVPRRDGSPWRLFVHCTEDLSHHNFLDPDATLRCLMLFGRCKGLDDFAVPLLMLRRVDFLVQGVLSTLGETAEFGKPHLVPSCDTLNRLDKRFAG